MGWHFCFPDMQMISLLPLNRCHIKHYSTTFSRHLPAALCLLLRKTEVTLKQLWFCPAKTADSVNRCPAAFMWLCVCERELKKGEIPQAKCCVCAVLNSQENPFLQINEDMQSLYPICLKNTWTSDSSWLSAMKYLRIFRAEISKLTSCFQNINLASYRFHESELSPWLAKLLSHDKLVASLYLCMIFICLSHSSSFIYHKDI